MSETSLSRTWTSLSTTSRCTTLSPSLATFCLARFEILSNLTVYNFRTAHSNDLHFDIYFALPELCKLSQNWNLIFQVAHDERNNSKGYGFVHFETQDASDQAIQKVNGMLLNDKKVYVGMYLFL